MTTNRILSHREIYYKIERISYLIYESNVEEESLIVIGIAPNGYILAQRVADHLKRISPLNVRLCQASIHKEYPFKVSISIPESDLKNKSIVLIDDVLNSGKTLIYAIKYFLDFEPKQFKTAVLVNRNHKLFPVKVDFKGISFSTSTKENVKVILNGTQDEVVLETER